MTPFLTRCFAGRKWSQPRSLRCLENVTFRCMDRNPYVREVGFVTERIDREQERPNVARREQISVVFHSVPQLPERFNATNSFARTMMV